MTDKHQRIRTLCSRFFDGSTTLAEEQELYAFFNEATNLPADLQDLRPLFTAMATLPQAYADPLQPTATTKDLRPKASRRWAYWAAVAALAAMLLGGATLLFRQSQPSANSGDELVAYIYGERTTDPAVVLAEMQTTMGALQGDGGDVVEKQLKAMFDD